MDKSIVTYDDAVAITYFETEPVMECAVLQFESQVSHWV